MCRFIVFLEGFLEVDCECRMAQNHTLNRECASHLAKKVISDLNVLIQFMEALDNSQFPHSAPHLHSAHQAMTNFISSIQEPTSVFRDEPPSMY